MNDEDNLLSIDLIGDKKYGFDKSIINSIRRTILSDIPTVGFRFLNDKKNKSMKIIQNNTPLHNEYILHRISLIPLYIDNNSYKSLLFHMKVENKDHPVIKITSQHFMIYPLKKM